jgi:hypothetical protein
LSPERERDRNSSRWMREATKPEECIDLELEIKAYVG